MLALTGAIGFMGCVVHNEEAIPTEGIETSEDNSLGVTEADNEVGSIVDETEEAISDIEATENTEGDVSKETANDDRRSTASEDTATDETEEDAVDETEEDTTDETEEDAVDETE